jgi:hypothetical protein
LPQASLAVQVRVTAYSCGHSPGTAASSKVKDGFGSQASDALGFEKFGSAGHSIVWGPPTPEIIGSVLSVTEIVCDAWEELPQSSVAVQVRVTEYSCGQAPGVVTSLKTSATLWSQLSDAVGVAKDGVDGHSTDDGPGNDEITGAVLSSTTTSIKQETGSAQLSQSNVDVNV